MDFLNQLPQLGWQALVGLWLAMCAVDALPSPGEGSSKLYLFLYRFAHGVAGNVFSRLFKTPPPPAKQ